VPRVHDLADRLTMCTRPGGDTLYLDTWRARRLSDDLRISEQVGPRDYDALEAALVELGEDHRFRKPRRGSDPNYRSRDARSQIMDAHARLLDALDEFSRQVNADLAALLQRELLETVDRYETLKARAGALDFVDLLLRTRDLVRDRPDVRAVLQRRLTHIFVDEFQDTDPLQAEILLLLVSADPSIGRWREIVPVPGKLFIVGDPKQSIYRFRGADVGTYQEVKTLLCERGAACLPLTTSFRSGPSIQALVNAAFAPLMTEDRATLQAGYVPLAPYRPDLPGQPGVVALPVPRPYGWRDVTKAAILRSLPDVVGAFLQWLLADSGWRVTERDRPHESQPIAPRHVCVLFRRFVSFGSDVTRPYVEALEARGVPHLLVGGKSFHAREEIESLRTALTAVEWPDDELSVYGTLKGPLFAIGDEELLEYRWLFRRLHPYRVPNPAPDHLAPVAQSLGLLRDLHRLRNRRPVEETVTELLRATRAHAGFVLRPWGEQALANILRIAELARAYEASGGISFRGFVERLREEAEGEAPEAPIVEEGSEGVRIMTVHRAKGLEFPVVVLADVTANIAPQHAGRHVDTQRGLCAFPLARCAPWDLLDHDTAEQARDRAEGVRVAYVAATRARDLFVVPAVGDDPAASGSDAVRDGWIAPLYAAIYPPAGTRRFSDAAPGCPPFGDDSVLERPDREIPGPDNVRPGLHAFATVPAQPFSLGSSTGAGPARVVRSYGVVWWDPRRLNLDAKPVFGIRRQELIEPAPREMVDADRKRYDDWQESGRLARERGSRPSIMVEPVTERVRHTVTALEPMGTVSVEVVDAVSTPQRPTGPRFGVLVHAVLATIDLDAAGEQVAAAVNLQARIFGAPPDEVAAAVSAVEGALAHPLIMRARAAWQAGACRREAPIAAVDADGALLEGVLDLAFEDAEGWIVIDFKTAAEVGAAVERYRRQVGLYASVVARATGGNVRGVLLRV
jgi:ATP-dependent helicase/nuclease subunit A